MTTVDYRHCRICQQDKPLDEFYKRHNGDPHTMCIECHKTYNSNRKQVSRRVAINKSEILVIDRLKANSIPSAPGKTLGYRWADVVAWGCVLIECKYSTVRDRDGLFSWSFSPIQQEQGLRAHIVVLCADYGSEMTYHVFDSHDPIFTKSDGTRKSGVTHTAHIRYDRKLKTGLTNAQMKSAQDNWKLIERYRLQVSAHLTDDMFLADWRVK